MRTIFVTGIGTDVGKSVVSSILTEALQADYWKPIQCGLEPSTDSHGIQNLISNSRTKIHPEAYRLKAALSPHAAAAAENIQIDINKIMLPKTGNATLIVEGAGGLMVPLNENHLVADLIKHLKAEVIVVCNFYLGSINHTLLTCSELKRRNMKVTGLIFNGPYNKASAEIILAHSGLKVLGTIGQITSLDKSAIKNLADQFVGI